MLWHAMPPELNTARLMAGAGAAPMLDAAAGWQALGQALESQAAELAVTLVSLKESWTGTSSERAIAATAPMVAWLHAAAREAAQRALQASAQASAYTAALAMTPSLPEIAGNHITHAVLTATNFLGINLVPIGFNETDYFVRMWEQAAGAMDLYQAQTAANTVFEPLPPVKPILQPDLSEPASGVVSALTASADEIGAGLLSQLATLEDDLAVSIPEGEIPRVGLPLAEQAAQFLQQLGQFSGPMQQLMQPVQQMTSLASQTNNVGAGMSDNRVDDVQNKPGDPEAERLGLLGASPLSNHPLAGGSGPSVGLGLMQAESLPGSGGSPPRTSLMTRLIEKPAEPVTPAVKAAAGSSASGGAAPLGMAGAAAQSGTSSRPALAAPAVRAEHHDDEVRDVPDDDW